MDIKTMGSRGVNILLWAIVIFVGGLIIMNVAQAFLGGKSPQTPYAQTAYDSTGYAHCVATQALANAKLADYFDGFINLSDEDILRLKDKREQDCKAIWGLQ